MAAHHLRNRALPLLALFLMASMSPWLTSTLDDMSGVRSSGAANASAPEGTVVWTVGEAVDVQLTLEGASEALPPVATNNVTLALPLAGDTAPSVGTAPVLGSSGTLSGALDRAGRVGNALHLADGATVELVAPNANTMSFASTGSEGRTMALWLHVSPTMNDTRFISAVGTFDVLWNASTSSIRVDLATDDGEAMESMQASATEGWHHLAFTSGANSVVMWLNGQYADAAQSANASGFPVGDGRYVLGGDGSTTLDDLTVWNTQLNAGDINAARTHNLVQWSIEPSLPAGLSLEASTGQITGIPTSDLPPTSYTANVTWTDEAGTWSDAVAFSATVSSPGVITSSGLRAWRGEAIEPLTFDFDLDPAFDPVDGPAVTEARLSLGAEHSCAITDAFDVVCWGGNEWAQLGDGQLNGSSSPQASIVPNLDGGFPVQVSAGWHHTCVLSSTGLVDCYGADDSGRSGGADGDVDLTGAASDVAAGWKHTCAVLENGTAYCWGDNEHAQLGNCDWSYSDSEDPVPLCNFPSSFGLNNRTISALGQGAHHTCALLDDGNVTCWGYGGDGRLGSGSTATSQYPRQTLPFWGGASITSVVNGDLHTCALLSDGTVSCWGRNLEGQLGTGTTDSTTIYDPMPRTTMPNGRAAVGVAAGFTHTCAVLDDGGVACWGKNDIGQLGDGTTADRLQPTLVTAFDEGRSAVDVAVGRRHTCALLDDGNVSCWGANGAGQLGDGTFNHRATPDVTYPLPGGRFATDVVAMEYATCALLGDGTVACWGVGTYGILGNGDTNGRTTPTRTTAFPDGRLATGISGSQYHVCAVTDAMDVVCWGRGTWGQLGKGDYLDRSNPNLVAGTFPDDVVAVSAGAGHTCAMLNDSNLRCWGSNSRGNLGDGASTSTTQQTHNVVTSNLQGRTFLSVSTGRDHTCSLLSDGNITCWGDNSAGQLGLTSTNNWYSPQVTKYVDVGRTAVKIAVGAWHTCALLEDASVSCWGQNDDHEALSNGTNLRSPTDATLLPGGIGVMDLSAGDGFTCALLVNGSVVCAGNNSQGQLGGGEPNATSPTTVAFPDGVQITSITSGRNHTCAIDVSMAVWCWGANTHGQLGTNTSGNASFGPLRIANLTLPAATAFSTVTWEAMTTLPDGFDLSPAGVLTGNATAWGENSTYLIAARIGAYTAYTSVWIDLRPPLAVNADADRLAALAGVDVPTWTPSVNRLAGASWTVEPALPEGMTFDPSTGAIAGAPTAGGHDTTHVITATAELEHANWSLHLVVLNDTDGDGLADDVPASHADLLQEDVDDDNDGRSDVDEAAAGTDPLDVDTNDDGVCDGPLDMPPTCLAFVDNSTGNTTDNATDNTTGNATTNATGNTTDNTTGNTTDNSTTNGSTVDNGTEATVEPTPIDMFLEQPLEIQIALGTVPVVLLMVLIGLLRKMGGGGAQAAQQRKKYPKMERKV